jgi:Phosphoenolpyruvate phosphomutase
VPSPKDRENNTEIVPLHHLSIFANAVCQNSEYLFAGGHSRSRTQNSADDSGGTRWFKSERAAAPLVRVRLNPLFGSADECLNEAAKRAKAYADAGADGIFVPGLTDLALIEKFARLTPLPVNIMVTQGVPEIPDRARVGVRRVSLGPWPMMAAMHVFGQAAAAVAARSNTARFCNPTPEHVLGRKPT